MAYPPELGDRATSLDRARPAGRTGSALGRDAAALSRRYGDLLDGRFDAILDAWRERAGQPWSTRHVGTVGTAGRDHEGIDHLGALLVRVGDRDERIVAGEVSWL
jgi:biotin-(acetyl-CoA carboxylase) ligase